MNVYSTAGAGRAPNATAASSSAINPSADGAGRMTGIDAARGIAMVFVCVSHVRYFLVESAPALYGLLTNITRLATPTFLLLSGFIAAYVLSSGRREARLSLIDRGLFVLVAGHLALNWADLSAVGLEQWMFARVTVTDAIAVCLVMAAISARLPSAVLASVGASIALLSWPIASLWEPESQIARYTGIMLFAVRSESSELADAALVPYLGLFLLGMSLSRWCSPELVARNYAAAARKLFVVASLAIVTVIVGVVAWHVLRPLLSEGDTEAIALARLTLDPRIKLPPSPAYLLFYGGGGLLIAAWCLVGRPAAVVRPIVHWAATLGRASLMCFVVQDWLLVGIPALLAIRHVQSLPFWTAYLVVVLIVLHALATRWDRARANRFLTVGLKQSFAARKASRTFAPFVESQAEGSRPPQPR